MEIVGFTLKHDCRPVFDKIAINLKAPNHQLFTLKWGPNKNGIVVIHEKTRDDVSAHVVYFPP